MASLKAGTVLITGCSRGIGLELVKQFLGLPMPPAHIFASCRSPDTAHELQQISKDNPSVTVLKIDVEDATTIESAALQMEQILDGSGLNLLINNAGISRSEQNIDDVEEETMISIYRVNTVGPLLVTKRFLPLIRKAAQTYGKDEYSASRAAIMNISSKRGSMYENKSAGYYSCRCSKIALHMISKNLSIELEADKILVVNLNPGWVKTDMGGPNAIIPLEKSVNGLMNVMATRTKEHNALLFDFEGETFRTPVGCSRGIGLEFVKQFVRLPSPQSPPVHIFASCRSPDTAHELQQISKDNPSVTVLKIDVEDKTTIDSAALQVEQILAGSGLNLLINNAAISEKEEKIDDVTEEAMISNYRVNTVGPLLVVKRFLPLIRKAAQTYGKDEYSASRAAIMNISTKLASIEDNRSARYYSYRCSKAALHMVSKNLSIELEADKILVVNLHPGWVRTERGGPNAPISTEECVNALLKVMATRTKEHNALFYDFKGVLIPW
ncbi:uncharacterized protein [Ptychodera flava]|uniref:uncharacterized protein n=1 Tax=Ptychodera flava TaxID=63121 RepID=UPI003969E3B1